LIGSTEYCIDAQFTSKIYPKFVHHCHQKPFSLQIALRDIHFSFPSIFPSFPLFPLQSESDFLSGRIAWGQCEIIPHSLGPWLIWVVAHAKELVGLDFVWSIFPSTQMPLSHSILGIPSMANIASHCANALNIHFPFY
jgi:hypothetical protein